MDADAVQCDACGELQRTTAARDRSGKLASDFLKSHRGPGASAAGNGGQVSSERKTVPVRAIARWTSIAAAGLLILAALCLGLAWLVDSLTLPMMQAATTAAFAAAGAIALGIVTALVWRLINAVERQLIRLDAARARRERKRQEQEEIKALYEAEAQKAKDGTKLPPKSAPPQYIQRPRPKQRPIPSQLTLVFSVMGILCGLMALVNSLMPLLGMFQYKEPLIVAVVFTVLAWTLSFYEGSQKLLPSVSLSLIIVAIMVAWGQMVYWGEAAEDIGNEIREYSETFRHQQKPGVANPFATPSPGQQLLNVINTGLHPTPTPNTR